MGNDGGNDGRMTERRCAHCGHPLGSSANFCAECGAATAAASIPGATGASRAAASIPTATGASRAAASIASPTETSRAAASIPATETSRAGSPPAVAAQLPHSQSKTLLHFGAAVVPSAGAPAGAPAAAPKGLARTMLGIPSGDAPALARAAPQPPVAASAATSPAVRSPVKPADRGKQTMLGVAIPGIAPLRPGEATAPATPRVASPSPVAATLPAAAAAPSMPAAVVSAAEPAAEIPTPVPPKIAAKGGVPLAAVALLAGALVLVGGLAITWLWRSAPPIAAQARSSADGSDVLVLQCDPRSCKDGTVVEAAGSKATFVAGKAELTLAEPMHIGDNHLSLRIDRPGFGRDEVVSMVVPVAYRVRADVSPMRDDPPRIAVDVEALPQSHVVVGDRTVALDARGIGQTVVDETAATTGPADESRAVVVDFPYTVTPPGQPPATGTVSARVSVAPLRVDAPGEHAIVEGDALVVAGRAAKGASITVDGKPVEAAADGSFETTVALPALGERVVDVRAGTATLAPRHVRIVADRVASLAAEAKRLEGRATPGYDAVMADVAAHVGQAMVVEGEVIESRTLGHRTVALVDDRRGCARGPCLVRVVLSQNVPLERGRTARAFGSVARGYSPSPGQTVPELDADFVLQSKR